MLRHCKYSAVTQKINHCFYQFIQMVILICTVGPNPTGQTNLNKISSIYPQSQHCKAMYIAPLENSFLREG